MHGGREMKSLSCTVTASLALLLSSAAYPQPHEPTVELSLEPQPGGVYIATWRADWAESCIASGLWLGVKAASGSEPIGPFYETGELLLTCFHGPLRAAALIKFDAGVSGGGAMGAPQAQPYVAVTVFFGTDRVVNQGPDYVHYADIDWSSTVDYGIAEVSIPKAHRPGELERPSWWRFEFLADPVSHLVVRHITRVAESEFFANIGESARLTGQSEIFLFVHGYHVEHNDALLRTAQLAYDLRLAGPAVAYSWPSNKDGLVGYNAAGTNAMKTAPHFLLFVEALREQTGVSAINVLAHSMGNRLVLDAMHESSRRGDAPMFSHVLLAAPDIDAHIFKRDVEPALSASLTTTMYSSTKDRVLVVSQELNGFPRAGAQILIIGGVETIDASEIDLSVLGHSYYATSLIQDMFYLLRGRTAAERYLHQSSNVEGVYWILPSFP